MDLPARMRADFSRTVQDATDDSGLEATPKDLWDLFDATYLAPGRDGSVALTSWSAESGPAGEHRFVCTLRVEGREGDYEGTGGGAVSAFTDALEGAGVTVTVLDFAEHGAAGGPVTAYAECRVGERVRWGAGQDASGVAASVAAVLSAVNRAELRAAPGGAEARPAIEDTV